MLLAVHWIHTLTFAANLRVLAFPPTLATVELVCAHIHTLLLAAIPPGAPLCTTNPRVHVACSCPCINPRAS